MLGTSKDRKLKERQSRDELILSVAKRLLVEQGMAGLSMQAIADQTDYSKGTIYQHYGCKEDIVAKLAISCGESLISMIDLALQHAKSVRHKVVLVSAAYFINGQAQPEIANLVSNLNTPEFQEKVSQTLLDEFKKNEDIIIKRILTLFSQGTGFDSNKVMDAAFGWWSMQWGVQDILAKGWNMQDLGFADPVQYFFRSLHIYLDGLGVPEDEACHDWAQLRIQAQQIFQTNCE
ncbi:MAG: TetR/AcrR family transcriptional regulator [Bermanella sp.]